VRILGIDPGETTFHASGQVDGEPKGQPRPRAFSRGGRAAVFDPGTAEGWKGEVARQTEDQRPSLPLEGPVEVEVLFYMPRPKRLCRARDDAGPIPCTAKPDNDNLAKAVLDAWTQQGWWRDDSQVHILRVAKYYHAKGSRPGMVWSIAGEL